jgi:hypothetical protein
VANAEEVAFNDPPAGAAEEMVLNQHLRRLIRYTGEPVPLTLPPLLLLLLREGRLAGGGGPPAGAVPGAGHLRCEA